MDQSHTAPSLNVFTESAGRRATLRSLGAAAMALLAALGLPAGGEAKKKKGRNRKKCKGNTKKCGKKCIPRANCCTDSDCDGGACVDGTCQCLSGSQPCDGACIPDEQCCDAADCDDGNPCTQGTCNSDRTCSYPNKPDLSYCGGNNSCSGGVCATPPDCYGGGLPCFFDNEVCCSNICLFDGPPSLDSWCSWSNPGQPCRWPDDCSTGQCVGFVCRA